MLTLQKVFHNIFARVTEFFPEFDVRVNRWTSVKSSSHTTTETPGVLLLNDTQTPFLSNCDTTHLLEFYHKVRSLHASGIPCDLKRWIVGYDIRENLYWLLFAENLINDRETMSQHLSINS